MESEEALPFWFDEKEPGASEQEIADAESYVGHELPSKLRSLLRQRNGGVSNYAGYIKDQLYLPFLPVFGVGTGRAAGTLSRAHDVRKAFGVPENVLVFAGQGHAWWGLEYQASTPEPRVIFRENAESEIICAASTFDELVEGLVEE